MKTDAALPVLKAWLATVEPRQFIAYLAMMSAVRISHPDVYDKINELSQEHPFLFRDSQFSFILRLLLDDPDLKYRKDGRQIDAAVAKKPCLMITHGSRQLTPSAAPGAAAPAPTTAASSCRETHGWRS